MLEPARDLRCAIYTRKSTDEGLDLEFNSLQAQRESAEAYILSQCQAGWTALATHYDDGGFSGATLERPALSKLLADIEAGRVDCVVVYKVDRLSRSLLDFARLMTFFEGRGVSFVSVTQEFNSTTSLGRLTLNILLSFAQFEREIIGERTRDKMAAARRKGKWTGGVPVLGYDLDPRGRRLVVNEAEAERVREIFAVAERAGALGTALREVNQREYTTKDWTSSGGRRHAGSAFSKSTLAALLGNVLYTGSVRHKGLVYAGEQAAIVDRDVWARVNEQLKISSASQRGKSHHKQQAPLLGLLYCAECGGPMSMVQTRKHGQSYAYYACKARQPRCKHRCAAARDLERQLLAQLEPVLGADPSWLSLQQAIERVAWDGQAREVAVSLRDRTRFRFRLLRAHGRESGRGSPTIPRVSRLLALAIEIENKLRNGTLRDYAEAARLGTVSQSRLRQILTLLNLSPAIQEAVLFLPRTVAEPGPVTEQRLRGIAELIDWPSQQARFDELLANGNLV